MISEIMVPPNFVHDSEIFLQPYLDVILLNCSVYHEYFHNQPENKIKEKLFQVYLKH